MGCRHAVVAPGAKRRVEAMEARVAEMRWSMSVPVDAMELHPAPQDAGGEAGPVRHWASRAAARLAACVTRPASPPDSIQPAAVSPSRSSAWSVVAQEAMSTESVSPRSSRNAAVTSRTTGRTRRAARSNCHAGNQVVRLPRNPTSEPDACRLASAWRVTPSSSVTCDVSRRSPTTCDHAADAARLLSGGAPQFGCLGRREPAEPRREPRQLRHEALDDSHRSRQLLTPRRQGSLPVRVGPLRSNTAHQSAAKHGIPNGLRSSPSSCLDPHIPSMQERQPVNQISADL